MSWIAGRRARLRLLFGRRAAETRMEEEFRFHIDMETDRVARELGLEPAAARRQALITFGGVDRHREGMREGRGLGSLSGISLDVKLGLRMLAKYPGVTIAAGLALATSVTLAAGWFEFLNDMASPRPAVVDAKRFVLVQNYDQAAAEPEPRSLHDFEQWRKQVTSLTDLSAVARSNYTVRTDGERVKTVRVARITPGGLRLTGVAPVLGRTLVAADEEEGSPLPVVIGHGLWQELFDGDRSVIGRSLRLGDTPGIVVGVFPEGFGFPTNQELWAPLRERAEAYERRAGPALLMFGQLAPGASLKRAQAELSTIAERTAAEYPATHAQLRPRVLRFKDVVGMGPVVRIINLPFILFLVVVCANVATLSFARTTARSGEIAVRSALGASRRRLVVQLVAEALVLTAVAAAVGLAVAQWGYRRGMALFWEVQQTVPPYWFEYDLSVATILYVFVLTGLAALMIGGIPALKATGRKLRTQFVQAGAGGAGMRFGAVSTGVIVVQVAVCVAFLPIAIERGRALLPDRETEARFPADEFLAARIALSGDNSVRGGPAAERRAAELFARVKQRLTEVPGVAAATFVSRLPGFNHPIEPMQLEADTAQAYNVRVVGVDADFFALMNARVVAGRPFGAADFESEADAVIVDASWARDNLPGRNPIGQRIRFPRRDDRAATRWHEIVGVVDGMRRAIGPGERVGVYAPLRTGKHAQLQLYLRTMPPPATLVPAVEAGVASVSPTLAIEELKPLDAIWRPVRKSDMFFLAMLNVVGLSILLFALAGIYALMSFTVAQRAREIAIRAALGANPRRIIAALFSRAIAQIALGVVAGAAVVSLTVMRSAEGAVLVGGVAALMTVVGLAGCFVPALRAVRIQPTKALKAE